MNKQVLLIDFPAYRKTIPVEYYPTFVKRLELQAYIENYKLPNLVRGNILYSRSMLVLGRALAKKGISYRYLSFCSPSFIDELINSISNYKFFAITFMTPSAGFVNNICSEIKKRNKEAVIIIGGHHSTALQEKTLEELDFVDVNVIGKGEVILPRIIENYPEIHNIPNIYYRDNSNDIKFTFCDNGKQNIDVDFTGLPNALSLYSHNVLTQSGCKNNCSYCMDGLLPLFYRPIKNVVDELQILDKALPSKNLIYISDSIFTSNRDRCIQVAREISRRTNNLKFVCEIRPEDGLDYELINELAKARFVQFNFGIEDSNTSVLEKSNRYVKYEIPINACKTIRSITNGLIGIHWITGLPGTSITTLENNIYAISDLIENNLADIVSNKIFVPYPGTDIFTSAESYGVELNLNAKWYDYDRFSYPVYDLSDSLSSEEIYEWFIKSEEMTINKYLTKLDFSNYKISSSEIRALHSNNDIYKTT